MNAPNDVDLPIGDELLSKILESSRSILPVTSYRDVQPGEVMTVEVRSRHAEFPEKTCFSQATSGCFEVDEVALRPWLRAPRVLQARDRGDRTDLASVDELLCRVVVPTCVDLVFTVRNVGSTPQRFVCGIVSRGSVVDRREDLLFNCSGDRRPLDYARWWWREDHQRLVDLSEAAARKIEAVLTRCADGSSRRDFRVDLGLEHPAIAMREEESLTNPDLNPTQAEGALPVQGHGSLWTKVPRALPLRGYGRREVELQHPTRISRGVETTVHGVLSNELTLIRPDQFEFAVADPDAWVVRGFRVNNISQLCKDEVRLQEFDTFIVGGECPVIREKMTFEMDVVFVGPGTDAEFCCRLSGLHVPSKSMQRRLRGGRYVPVPIPGYDIKKRLTRRRVSVPVDRPVELVDLVVRDASDWVVSEVTVDSAPWIPWRLGTAEQLARCMRMDALWAWPEQRDDSSRVVPPGSVISMEVLYVGRRESAEFWGCLVGRAPLGGDDAPTCGPWAMRLDVSTGERRSRPRVESMLVTEHLAGPPVRIESIDVVSPEDWVVNDLRIDGRSMFANTNDVAGEALREMGQLGMHLGVARDKVELLVSYVGDDEAGATFRCIVEGSATPTSRPEPRHGAAQAGPAGVGWDPWPE